MINHRLKLVFLAASFSLTTSCAIWNTDLVDDGIVQLDTIAPDKSKYIGVKVTQEGAVAKVSGVVSLRVPAGYGPFVGHMDVIITDKQGAAILIGSTSYRRAYPSEHPSHARFEISSYTILPDQSKVILRHHDAPMDTHLPSN